MSEEQPIEVGDVVRLHSGGPQMTVTGVSGENVTVSWIDNNSEPHQETFPAASLVNVKWRRKKQTT